MIPGHLLFTFFFIAVTQQQFSAGPAKLPPPWGWLFCLVWSLSSLWLWALSDALQMYYSDIALSIIHLAHMNNKKIFQQKYLAN